MKKLYFISGLPRSGSTILTSILNQNPNFYAEIHNPLMNMIFNVINVPQDPSNYASSPNYRVKNTINGVISGFYQHIEQEVCFNTNRCWTVMLNYLYELNPEFKVICTVRNYVDILNSMENLFLKRKFLHVNTIYPDDMISNVWNRTNYLAKDGFINQAYLCLREAYYGKYKNHLLLVEYNDIVNKPSQVITKIYDFIGEPKFNHSFDDVSYSFDDYDNLLLLKGLHEVKPRLEKQNTPLVLPPELCEEYKNWEFWRQRT